MAIDQAQRPQFFEGQYLGAEDLTATVEYSRLLEQRHALGAHTWGIAIGLTLVETPTPDGSGAVTVSISPGYAWDGFGRPIVVLAPYQVPADLFKSLTYVSTLDGGTLPGRSIPLWLQYTEVPAQPPANGFAVCGVGNQNSRVQETFQLVAGDRNPSAQRDPITVSTWVGDASLALEQFDPQVTTPLADASIPHQNFPDDNSAAVWLVPLGCIQWLPNQTAGQPGSFVQTTILPSDDPTAPLTKAKQAFQALSDSLRQYISVVAGAVQAPDHIIHLKDRDNPPSTSTSTELTWPTGAKAPVPVPATDLVWVEGPLRADEDINLIGGKVDFKDGAGNDTSLQIQRANNNNGGIELEVVIGNQNAGTNDLAIGPLDNATGKFTPEVVVLDNGNVGIGASGMNARLEVVQSGTTDGIRVSGGTNPLLVATDGTIRTKLQVLTANSEGLVGTETNHNFGLFTNNTEKVTVTSGGNVGVGTTGPNARLEVAQSGTSDGIRVSGGTNPLVTATDGTIRAKLQVVTASNEGLVGTESSHNFGVYTSNIERMTITSGGNVGIGNTSPTALLDIANNTKFGSDGSIASPLWNVSQPLRTQGVGLPQSGHFNSGGGSFLLFVSGSGFSSTGAEMIGVDVFLDFVPLGSVLVFTNESFSHKAFTANAIVVRGFPAGAHTVTLSAHTGSSGNPTSTDFNDFFNVTILELPF
jgi:hypothetical protein